MSGESCGAQCKAELSCKYLGFGLASELTTDRSSNWQEAFGGKGAFGGNRTHLLIFKCFSAVLMTSILVWSIAGWVNSFAGEGKAASGLDPDGEDDDAYLPAHSGAGAFSYWPTKVTHWTLTVQVFYLWLSTYTTYKATEVTDVQLNSQSSMPFYVKLTWYLHAVTLPATFFVFALYWGLVFDGTLHAVSVATHGVNFIVQFIDSFVTRMPYRYIHGLYFLGYMITYLTYTVLYYACGGGNEKGKNFIYGSLDWGGNPGGTTILVAMILLVLVPIIHSCFWCCKYRNANSSRSPALAGATPAAL